MKDLRFNARALTRLAPLAAWLLLGVQASAPAAPPSAKAALALQPVQEEVDHELVPPEEAEKCSVTDLTRPGWSGWEVTGSDGSLLRRFADTNGDKKVDLWCYFKFGVEVYRDIDEDFNGKADQYRWLGTGGSRWGLDDDEDGNIDRWQQISAEEVSAEVVVALRDADADRFARLLITPEEVASLGLGAEKSEQITAKADRAAREFEALAKRQKAVTSEARWVQFAASVPGVVPRGTDGSTKDVLVYENAVAMFEDADRSGQMMVGTLIQVAGAWRLVELPSVGDGGEAIAQSTGIFFTPDNAAGGAAMGADNIAPQAQEYVAQLEKIDQSLTQTTNATELASLHERRADLVESLIEASSDAGERDTWVRQLVDTLSVAAQTGSYPDGVKRLRTIAQKYGEADDALKSYADFQAISTEYAVRQNPDADFAKVQEWYLESLGGFVDRYPKTLEASQAWLQLALSKEFEDKVDDALEYYKKVASAFPGTDAGEKATGAVRRLESVGRVIDLQGSTLDGKPFRLAQLRGKPIVLHYWATWCEPCKQDMTLLLKLQASYQRAGLQVVGVNVDLTRELAESYRQEAKWSKWPWVQLFEEGGLESSGLAKALGVQTLPTMLLIDADGKVVRHNLRAAELEDELATLLKPVR